MKCYLLSIFKGIYSKVDMDVKFKFQSHRILIANAIWQQRVPQM